MSRAETLGDLRRGLCACADEDDRPLCAECDRAYREARQEALERDGAALCDACHPDAIEDLLARSALIAVRLLTASSSWAELEARCAKGYAPTLRAGHSDSPERAWLLHALRVEVLRAGYQVFPEPTTAELRAAGRDGGAA